MKKAILAGLLALTIVAPVHGAIYPNMGEVTAVLPKANGKYKVVFKDGAGRPYSWIDNSGDWFTGDFVAVIMDDNGTPTVYDDSVLDARYVGYVDLFI